MTNLYESFLDFVIGTQQKINFLISDYFDRLDAGDSNMFIYILAVSFIYGLIHALGPGHGKMVIASYFLVRGAKTKEAFKAGFLTSIIHTVSALIITFTLYLFFQSTITKYFSEINTNMYKVSAIFIISIALYLLYEIYKDRNIEEKEQRVGNKSLLAITMSIGIVPCPGVMSIVLFSLILGYIKLGILSAVVMSIGMGITISLAAILTTQVRKSNSKTISSLMSYISYAGIAILIIMGTLLLI
ncbi:nickel/cobalt transporter [Halarcobacter anaerophilus]|jgi:ABC-type nickel/cobalt efflux system permease component RcnA|uniref:nickel/cobalt transporter n=1 Tax=Halarcobacter anaerophilus TaxID=877500 RepID=UPI0005CA179C|nr:nickel transporter [Halarcobacter anaerophilus]